MAPTDAEIPQNLAVANPNPRNNTTMFQIFQNVQYNVVQHKKYVKEMRKLYKKLDEDTFRESFRNALQYLFTFGDTSANVDRAIQFVATFCTSLDDEEEFLMFIFDIIFNCQCVSGQSVRYRASQLLAAVLSALGDDASLDDDLCEKLLASQMQRLQDTRGAVRCRAALALQRLQNPMEPEDQVTLAYRFHMSCDPSASVRRAIVMSIAKCTRNVPYVLQRLCDVDEAVRRAAFLYIASINVVQLRVKQRVFILKVGLTERSYRVRRVVEEIVIPGWLSSFKGNIVELLKAIRLDNANDAKDSQYVAGKLLESLFKRLQVSELLEWLPTDKKLRLIAAEKLNKETAWYWRHLAEHLQRIDDDETLETILPDLVVLTGYIRAIVESPCPSQEDDPVGFSTRQYVLQELGSMLKVYDASDPAGRSELQSLICDVLTGDYGHLSPEVIRAFVSALELVEPDVMARMQVVCGLVSALREPPEPEAPPPAKPVIDPTELKIQRAKLRVSLNVAMEAQEDAVSQQNYALAAECKAKVEDIQKKLEELNVKAAPPPPVPLHTIKDKLSDTETLNKCLIILNCAMDSPQLKSITPTMQMIFNEMEVDIFQNPEILENALETVALFGMLDKEFVKENKAFFFVHLSDPTNEPIVTVVLKCVVDLLCVHGARAFEDDTNESSHRSESRSASRSKRSISHSIDALNDDGSIQESVLSLSPSHNTVIQLLLRLLDTTCTAYRLIIVEGFCRLIYLGHLESPDILSRLLLLWFSPNTAEEDMLRQTIGVFFQTFPASVDGAQDQIQKATIPTLRALANAPSVSPLAEIDQEAIVRFIVSLTRVNHELIDSQGAMAMTVCSHLVRRPNSAEVGLACRLLALLSPPRDAHVASDLATMLRDLVQKLPDKQSCRNLTRYLGALEALERASLNKMSNTGLTEGTMQSEDTMAHMTRITTSLPQPLARSTHVVVNETVEEEVEIDMSSPGNAISTICEESTTPVPTTSPKSSRQSSSSNSSVPETDDVTDKVEKKTSDEDSSGVSPVKKAKIPKGKKKKLSMNRRDSESDVKPKEKKASAKEKIVKEELDRGGVKRSRSQRSVVDVERAQKAKAEPKTKNKPKNVTPPEQLKELDIANVTVRKSKSLQPTSSIESASSNKNGRKKKTSPELKATKKSSRISKRTSAESITSTSANSSKCSAFEDSDDETELHTIVYDNEMEPSPLDQTSELEDSKEQNKGNVTIPETPDASDESESEPEPVMKLKPKRNGKKK